MIWRPVWNLRIINPWNAIAAIHSFRYRPNWLHHVYPNRFRMILSSNFFRENISIEDWSSTSNLNRTVNGNSRLNITIWMQFFSTKFVSHVNIHSKWKTNTKWWKSYDIKMNRGNKTILTVTMTTMTLSTEFSYYIIPYFTLVLLCVFYILRS